VSIFNETILTALAGGAGGAVRWVTFQEGWRKGIGSLFVGALSAIYASAAVEPLFVGIIANEAKRAAFASFFIGVVGMLLVGFFVDFFKTFSRNIINRQEDKP